MDYARESLKLHKELKGKIDVVVKRHVNNRDDLSLVYTPGVAAPCLAINKNVDEVYDYTWKGNTIAVITDGTAVLGLGDIGPEAGMPVMEGKAALFKEFAGINAIPICVNTKDTNEIVNTIYHISSSFGGINLEDISAPRCIEIEERLRKMCNIPVFHDDQHGTAIVVAAATINACKVTGRKLENSTVVINGAGSAGMAIAKLLIDLNIGDIILCDKTGVLDPNSEKINKYQKELALRTNKKQVKGTLIDALKGADIFVGVSAANVLKPEMVKQMNKDPIVFAMANPIPEIMPDVAKAAGVKVMGTGRSDFPNQINNVLAFPGVFRGALDVKANDITKEMRIAAAYAIANLVPQDKLAYDYIMPRALDKAVAKTVAKAVSDAWKNSHK